MQWANEKRSYNHQDHRVSRTTEGVVPFINTLHGTLKLSSYEAPIQSIQFLDLVQGTD